MFLVAFQNKFYGVFAKKIIGYL